MPYSKREWPDGEERICDGSNVVFANGNNSHLISVSVNELPREVYKLQKECTEDMLELHHHADPEVPTYIRVEEIIAILPRWNKMEER